MQLTKGCNNHFTHFPKKLPRAGNDGHDMSNVSYPNTFPDLLTLVRPNEPKYKMH